MKKFISNVFELKTKRTREDIKNILLSGEILDEVEKRFIEEIEQAGGGLTDADILNVERGNTWIKISTIGNINFMASVVEFTEKHIKVIVDGTGLKESTIWLQYIPQDWGYKVRVSAEYDFTYSPAGLVFRAKVPKDKEFENTANQIIGEAVEEFNRKEKEREEEKLLNK